MAKFGSGRLGSITRPGLAVAIGLGFGYLAESNTDKIAESKMKTIEICREITPVSNEVSLAFHACITEGAQQGTPIAGNKLKVGDPVLFIENYYEAQKDELEIETERLLIYAAAALAIRAVAVRVP